MKRLITAAILLALSSFGCSGAFWGGTGLGVLGTGAGYEIQAKRQMDKLEDDYKAGRIDRREYEIRKSQIERGSILY